MNIRNQDEPLTTLSWFDRIGKSAERLVGHPTAFIVALLTILIWSVSGPIFGFSDTWQLIINTATTIVTFLMVFLIQNTQNRTTAALQLKVDEVIRALRGAHNALVRTDDLSLEEIERLRAQYDRLAVGARTKLDQGQTDIGSPEVMFDKDNHKNNKHARKRLKESVRRTH